MLIKIVYLEYFISSATRQAYKETPKRLSWSNQCSKSQQTALSDDSFLPFFSKASTQWYISSPKWVVFGPNI